MKNAFVLAGACAASFTCSVLNAHENHAARADSHAPIGVMADHMHKEGEWMFSYRYMHMAMEGNRDGDRRLSTAETLAAGPGPMGYMVAPLKMDMQMHMFGAMYAPSDKVTLMLMVPYLETEMDHETASGGRFITKTEGLGDIRVAALLPLYDYQGGKMHATMALSLPTGSIEEKDQTPASMGNEVILPYPMQLGSGTYDLRPAITWSKLNQGWSWGAQTTATIRLGGDNDRDYRLGNALDVQSWVAWNLSSAISVSSRLQWQSWQNIEGADPAPSVNPMMVPTADPERRAGRRTDLHLGVNWLSSGGHRLALEYGVPVQQNLNGPQLEVDSTATIGYQYAF